MHFQSPKSRDIPLELNLNAQSLMRVDTLRFLGVQINHKLNWQSHINYVVNKLSKTTGQLYTIGRIIPTGIKASIFNSLVNSSIFYCISVWGGDSTKLKKVFLAQKKALRALFRIKKHENDSGRSHTKRHFTENNLLSAHNIYSYNIALETFKIMCYKEPHSFYSSILLQSNINKLRLTHHKNNISALFNNFCFSAPIIWNSIINLKELKFDFSTLHNIKFKDICKTILTFKCTLKKLILEMQCHFEPNEWHDYNNNLLLFIKYIKLSPYRNLTN